MNICAMVGQKGVGKTSLFRQITASITAGSEVTVELSPGRSYSRHRTLQLQRSLLKSESTSEVKRTVVSLTDSQTWMFFDTPGLQKSVSMQPRTRDAIADTFRLLFSCNAVLHVVDASQIGKEGVSHICEVDRGLYWLLSQHDQWKRVFAELDIENYYEKSPKIGEYGSSVLNWLNNKRNGSCASNSCSTPSYRIVANKMDLPWARIGKEKLMSEFPEAAVLPLSAKSGGSIRQVREFLLSSSQKSR